MIKLKSIVLGISFNLALLFFVGETSVFAQRTTPDEGDRVTPGSLPLENPLAVDTIPEFLISILQGIQLILAPIIVLMIIYAGFLFITAQGKQDQLTKAKKTFMWAIIGAAIILGAQMLANVVVNTLANVNPSS